LTNPDPKPWTHREWANMQRAAQGHAPRRALSAMPTLTPSPAPTTMAASTLPPILSDDMPGSAALALTPTRPRAANGAPPRLLAAAADGTAAAPTHLHAHGGLSQTLGTDVERAGSRPKRASASPRSMNDCETPSNQPKAPVERPRRPTACGQRGPLREARLSRASCTHRMGACGRVCGRRSRRKVTARAEEVQAATAVPRV